MQEDETESMVLDTMFTPKAVIIITNSDEAVRERVKLNIPPEELASSKYNDDTVNKLEHITSCLGVW